MTCQYCRFGIDVYGYQIECGNVESEYCGEIRDADDTCNLCKPKKQKAAKIEKPTQEEDPKPISDIQLNDLVKMVRGNDPEKPKVKVDNKNYKINPKNRHSQKVYLIMCNDHIAGFSNCTDECGGKHVYFHEEGRAREYCQRLTKQHKKLKYTYVECTIQDSP